MLYRTRRRKAEEVERLGGTRTQDTTTRPHQSMFSFVTYWLGIVRL